MEGVLPTVLRVTPGEELHVGVTSTRNRDDFGRFIGGGVIDLAGDADRIGGFFVKAFQSYLWNMIVAWRMGRFGGRVLAGDLAREGMAGKLEEVVLPLVG